jgi:hypothetical protein
MHFRFDSFGSGINRGCNVIHMSDVVSAIKPEIVLLPFIKQKLKCGETAVP